MKKLKSLLLYNKYFVIIGLFLVMYVIIITQIIKYNTFYHSGDILEGIITSYNYNGDKLVLNIKGKEKTIAYYYFKTEEEKKEMFNTLHIGDRVKIYGDINYPKNNTIPNTFNYKEYLYNKRIYVTWNANKIELIKNNKNPFNTIKDMLLKRAYNMKNSDYYLTFILGDKSLLSSEDYNNFQVNGISHILAISGMHIGILILLLSKIFNKFRYKNIIIILFLLIFVFLTSFSPSVLRSSIFIIFGIINKHLKLYFKPLHILIMTAYVLILVNPFIVYDIGFIYSFIVSFGILYYLKYINGNYIIRIFKVSVISFLFCLPITASLNYEINIMSVLSNLIIVPFFSIFVFPLALFSFIFPLFEPLFNLLILILNTINNYLFIIKIMVIIPKIPIYLLIFFYLVLLYMKNNIKLGSMLIVLIIICKILPFFYNTYRISYLDVNQGDSILMVMPHNNKTILIDTGGKILFDKKDWQKNSKEYKLTSNTIKYMKSIGVNHLDYLITTHGDFDHMGEAINLVNNFKVEKVIFNCGEYNELEQDLIKVLNKKKIPYYSCIKELNIDNNKLYFLQTKEYDNENDNSNVVYTEINGYKFMFMGDASITTEKEIIDKYNMPDIDVLKVGHHGSKTSSSKDFIDEMNPKYSIISVGKNNRYGHPNKEVLNNLENSKIYRTDTDGSIMFKIKNNRLKIETCSP